MSASQSVNIWYGTYLYAGHATTPNYGIPGDRSLEGILGDGLTAAVRKEYLSHMMLNFLQKIFSVIEISMTMTGTGETDYYTPASDFRHVARLALPHLTRLSVGLVVTSISPALHLLPFTILEPPSAQVPFEPVVRLDSAIVNGVDYGSVSKFLGIPYAQPPVGPLRFRPPQILGPYEESFSAIAYGPACPQKSQDSSFADLFPSNISAFLHTSPVFGTTIPPESEDCLTINVVKPSFVNAEHRLPVVVWIYGGGFETGASEFYDDQAVRIVQRSISLHKPVVLAYMNYRVSAFGFLGGKEVLAEGVGNLGLVDQRLALRWVNKYIEQFGGDNSRVTLWGESAGAVSIALQMLAYGGDTQNYFHSGFMQSGATISVGSILRGQAHYDFLVEETGCGNSTDTLECLRKVDYNVLKRAIDRTPNFHAYQSPIPAYLPRTDGLVIPDEPHKLVEEGRVARIPIVSGNCDDEGTSFAFSTLLNVWSEAQFRQYVKDIWLPDASSDELEPLWSLYSSNLPDGSPFDTGHANGLTPQFKRMAAFQGDAMFQAPRRFFLKSLAGKQKIWSYLTKQAKWIPLLGSFHGSDLVLRLTDDYLINFATNHDPNIGKGPIWPQYKVESPQLYTFLPGLASPTITLDDYRAAQFNFLTNISFKYPL